MLSDGIINSGKDLVDGHLLHHALHHHIVEVGTEQLPPPVVDRFADKKVDKNDIVLEINTQMKGYASINAEKLTEHRLITDQRKYCGCGHQ